MEGAAATTCPDAGRDVPVVSAAGAAAACADKGQKGDQILGDQGPATTFRARRTSSSSSGSSDDEMGMGAGSSSHLSKDDGKEGASSAAEAAQAATAELAAALLLPSPRPRPPPSPVDAAALVLASAAASATEQRQRSHRRRRHEARKQQQKHQQQQQATAAPASSSWRRRRCPRPLASLARAVPLLAAAALIGALVPALIAPQGAVVRQRWAPPTDDGAPTASSPSLLPAVRLVSTVARVDGAAGALELAFAATVLGATGAAGAATTSDDGAAACRLVVGVGATGAALLEIDLPVEEAAAVAAEEPEREERRHAFVARVPMRPSAAVATARTGAAYATSSQLPFPFDEWSSVVSVWAALERCSGPSVGGSGGDGSGSGNDDSRGRSSVLPSSCSRTPVRLEWSASMSSRSWRARVLATQVAAAVVGPDGGATADANADAVSLAQLRVRLSRPAPTRVLALLEMSARWLLGAYAALATANWAVAVLLLKVTATRGVDGGGGGGGLGGGAEEFFSTLD